MPSHGRSQAGPASWGRPDSAEEKSFILQVFIVLTNTYLLGEHLARPILKGRQQKIRAEINKSLLQVTEL